VVPVVTHGHGHHCLAPPIEQLMAIGRPHWLVTTGARHPYWHPAGVALHPNLVLPRTVRDIGEPTPTRREGGVELAVLRRHDPTSLAGRLHGGREDIGVAHRPLTEQLPGGRPRLRHTAHTQYLWRAHGAVSGECQHLRVGPNGKCHLSSTGTPPGGNVVVR